MATNQSPRLPPYSPPLGLVSRFPRSCIPYAELMRLHKPAGYYAFYVPHVIGTLWAPTVGSVPQPTSQLLRSNLIFLVGCLFLRGAACCWNDTLDAPYDRVVARCRHRPVARGAISPRQAHAFTFVQSAVCLCLLYAFPRTCLVPALMLVITMALYPFTKGLRTIHRSCLASPLPSAN